MLKNGVNIQAVILTLLSLSACHHEDVSEFIPVPIVGTALSDTSSVWYKAAGNAPSGGKDGAIAIFGGFDETAVLSEVLLTADIFDNIDGKQEPDGLPDFAGETVMPVFDVVNAPYPGYFGQMNEDFIRETAVKGFLVSASGHCSSSIFDSALSASKPSAKLFILSSSVLAGYGFQDIEYLASAAGIGSGIFNTVSSSVSELFMKASGPSNIGVWASRDVVSSGVYGNIFRDMRESRTKRHAPEYADWAEASEIVCLSPDMSGSAFENLRRFLDTYIAAEYDRPLSGVILDDATAYGIVDSLNIAADSLKASAAPEAEAYKKVMAPDFRFVSPVECVAMDCYAWLRENGRFTHLVAWPEAKGYVTAVSSEVGPRNIGADGLLADGYKYNRAQDSEIETFCIVRLSQSCLTPQQALRMKSLAPKTYNELIYVY